MIFWNATGELAPARNKAPNGRMEKAATFEGAAAMQNGKSTSFIDRNKSRAVRPVAVQNRNVGQAERAAPVMKPRPVRRAEDDDTVKLTKAQLNALLQAVTNGASLEDDDLADSGAAMRAGQRNVRQRKFNGGVLNFLLNLVVKFNSACGREFHRLTLRLNKLVVPVIAKLVFRWSNFSEIKNLC